MNMQELEAPTMVDTAAFFAAPPATPSELAACRATYLYDTAAADKFAAAVREARQGGNDKLAMLGAWVCGEYSKAIESSGNENDDLSKFIRGDGLREMGQQSEACKVLEGFSASADSIMAAAELHAITATLNYDALRKALKSAKVNEADKHYFEGRLMESDGDYDAAADAYNEAIALDEAHVAARSRLAYRADLHGDEDEALRQYGEMLMHRPVPISVLLNAGILHEDQGNFEKACCCFSAALRSNPNDKRALLFFQDAHESLDMYYDEDLEHRHDQLMKVLRTPITDFELSVRARNCLASMDIRSLQELVSHTELELLEFKNFGETSLNEIKRVLTAKNLRLGMRRDDGTFLVPDEFESGSDFDAERELAWLGPLTDEMREALELQISGLNLSVRCHRALVERLNLHRVSDILRYSEEDLMSMPNFGITSLEELKIRLTEFDLSLRSNGGGNNTEF